MVAVPDVTPLLLQLPLRRCAVAVAPLLNFDAIAAVVAVGEEDGGWRDDVGDGDGGRRGAVAGRRTL